MRQKNKKSVAGRKAARKREQRRNREPRLLATDKATGRTVQVI